MPTLPDADARYAPGAHIGEGGTAMVREAYDETLKRQVALKRLHADLLRDDDYRRRFVEEAQAAAQLEHPNVVPIYDLGLDAQGPYFTMKRIRGLTLRDVVRGVGEGGQHRGRPYAELYPARRRIEILVAVCQGVAYAHQKGVLHRDLKSANIMVGDFGEVRVMDWGLAKVRGDAEITGGPRITTSSIERGDDATQLGAVYGTPSYMSPEQARSMALVDERSDVYSLGAVLYEILGGARPYAVSSQQALVALHGGPPAPLHHGAPGFESLPSELVAICHRAMARAPEDRYPSVAALRDDLQAWLDGRATQAAPDTAWTATARRLHRHRRELAAVLGTAVLLGGLALGARTGQRQAEVDAILAKARSKRSYAAGAFEKALNAAPGDDDPYQAQVLASLAGKGARGFFDTLGDQVQQLERALQITPSSVEVRTELAETHMALWRVALYQDNEALQQEHRRRALFHAPDPSAYQDELDGQGWLSVVGADELRLYRYVEVSARQKDTMAPARLVPLPWDLATGKVAAGAEDRAKLRLLDDEPPEGEHLYPLADTPTWAGRLQLPPGSWLLEARKEGRTWRVPVLLERGEERLLALTPPPEDLPRFTWVMGGDFVVGGKTAGALAPGVERVEPFWLATDEVTMRAYGQFLAALALERPDEATQRLPRDFGGLIGAMRDGRLVSVEAMDAERFASSPVRGVSLSDAQAYIAWRSAQDGRRYRLPTDLEWEAACRGADGRAFSWGAAPAVGLATVLSGYGDSGATVSWDWRDGADESPWGVHSMAGSVAEWTSTQRTPTEAVIRGNAWSIQPVGLRCAFRTSGREDYFHPTIGFRLALDP